MALHEKPAPSAIFKTMPKSVAVFVPPAKDFSAIVAKWAADTEACAPPLHHLGYKEHVATQLPALIAALEAS